MTTPTNIWKALVDRRLKSLTNLWNIILELGHILANSDFEYSRKISRIAGSHANADTTLTEYFGNTIFEEEYIERKKIF